MALGVWVNPDHHRKMGQSSFLEIKDNRQLFFALLKKYTK